MLVFFVCNKVILVKEKKKKEREREYWISYGLLLNKMVVIRIEQGLYDVVKSDLISIFKKKISGIGHWLKRFIVFDRL
jgi:hypothetical protein